MLERHIFIIGMPGSGKSSLGRKVAANLRLGYVDTDRRIAELVGISIPEIFKKYGEAKFRTAEKNLPSLEDVMPAGKEDGRCARRPR